MGKTFVGCKAATEIAMTRTPQNRLSLALLAKTKTAGAGQTSDPSKENNDMATEAEIQKAAAAQATAIVAKTLTWDDVTKSYFVGLPADQHDAFLAKSAADQKTEAAEAKKAKDDAANADAELTRGRTDFEATVLKSLKDMGATVAGLALRVDDVAKGNSSTRLEMDLEKRANTEFSGYPGGVKAAVERLKTIAALPEAERGPFEEMMKSQIKLAASTMKHFSGLSEEDVTNGRAAWDRIQKKVDEVAKAKNITTDKAFVEVSEMSAFANDLIDAEEAGMIQV